MEPGLSSPPAFRHWYGAAVRPTDPKRNGGGEPPRQALPAAGRLLAADGVLDARFRRRPAGLMCHAFGAARYLALVHLLVSHRLAPGAALFVRLCFCHSVEIVLVAIHMALALLLVATRRAAADPNRRRRSLVAGGGCSKPDRRCGGAARGRAAGASARCALRKGKRARAGDQRRRDQDCFERLHPSPHWLSCM